MPSLPDWVRWRDLLDISALAVGAYFLYRTLRSMGTLKIALGIAIGGIVLAVANLLDLRGLEWIFSNLSQVTLIALIVIFQPELRRILERATPLRHSRPAGSLQGLAALLDQALFALAGRRWGAIVVIPGDDPIQRWVSEGVRLDAKPSFPLLLSIFDPESPGHDGAVVVEGERLTRFGVRLPLSQSGRLPEDLGTRHHAAMGLSEVTDALVLAVSEERGVVTCFRDGESSHPRESGQIAARVAAHWQGRSRVVSEVPARRRRALEALLSLGVALLFWSTVVVSQTQTQEMFLTVPVEFTQPPGHLVLWGDRPGEVRLQVAGPASALSSLDLTQVRARVDLSGAEEGRQTVPLTADDVRLPRNLRVVEIQPSSVEIELRAVREREVPVRPQLVGALPEGYRVVSVEVVPPTVRVLSPEQDGSGAPGGLLTTPIYLQSLRESVNVFCKIVTPVGVQPADRRWPDVEVRIEVARGQ